MLTVTNIPNPFCTRDTLPEVEIWSLADDFFDAQDEVCAHIRQRFDNGPLTVVLSSCSQAAPYLANLLTKQDPSVKMARRVWDLFGEAVDNAIFAPDSAFRQHYADFMKARNKVVDYMQEMEQLDEDFLFQFHCIRDVEMQEVVEQTVAQIDSEYGEACAAINRRHLLFINETLSSREDIEEAIKTAASCYDPLSITVLCRYGLPQEEGHSCFAEHAVSNRSDGSDSPFPADKYQVVIQNDEAVYHPPTMHVLSKDDESHVVLLLQNGKQWRVKDYGQRQPTDTFGDLQAKARQWLSMPSSLAMAGGLTNRDLALGLWEINNPTAKLCRIGFFGKDMEFEMFVNKQDCGFIPHFHVRRLGSKEAYLETRVKLKTNEYIFRDSQPHMRLDRQQCAMLAEFLQQPSHNLHYRTRYVHAAWKWTWYNYKSALLLESSLPDYRTIYDVVEVRVDLSQFGNKPVSSDIKTQASETIKEQMQAASQVD